MARHILRDQQLVTLVVVETTDAGTEDDGGDESGATPGQVNDPATCKVDDTDVEDLIISKGGEETAAGPHRVGDDGVNEGGQERRVTELGDHSAALRDSPGHNGCSCSSKGKLEEPGLVVVDPRAQEEILVPDEGNLRRVLAAVSETPTEGPETEGCTAGVEEIFKHDVLGVFCTNTTSAKHGESGLHEEYHGGAEYTEVGGVRGGFT